MSDNELWVFDKNDFKDAVTLLMLPIHDEKETNDNDLELKKLISMQFENKSDLILWTVDLFERVMMILVFSILRHL